MRTRFLSKMTNQEAEGYLEHNDIIIVPVGVTELHGGLPLDAETVAAEGLALKMAEACDGLVLHNLPYFYAGATLRGRGTVQVDIEPSIQYLKEVSRSLIRQGFRRQIFVSLHGPAHLYISPVIRDIFEEYKVPILYIDPIQSGFMEQMAASKADDIFSEIILGAYDLLGRIDDVPLTEPDNDFWTERNSHQSTVTFASKINNMAYASGAIGYYFGDHMDHMPTIKLESKEQIQELAENGKVAISQIINHFDMQTVVEQMKQVDDWVGNINEKYPWTKNI